ncbi:hypothetical protein CHS0354_012047 [Potamilus streckersoni]|uniref:RNA helicase n=1 Tax=Potamilus streckersoni TaxID=2493646 RepID=A0AAE0TJL5_9BIVA|nr:hypothetical protein CHS0354_012047 [Potamilus streckersoni]
MATASLSSEVSEPPSIPTEETIKFHLQAFIPMISETVDCDKLLAGLTDFNMAERRQIRDMRRNGGTSKDASYKILEMILEKDEPGIYRELLTVLEEDYPLVARVLTKGYIPQEHVIKEKKLQLFISQIVKCLNPTDVLPSLHSKSVISQQDVDEINAENNQHGKSAASMQLLMHISCHIEHWFENFLICLHDNSYAELAKTIDPDFIKDYDEGLVSDEGKYVKKREKFKDLENSMEIEHFVSDYHAADSSSLDLESAPSNPIKPDQIPKLASRGEPDGQYTVAVQQSPESMDCAENTARKLLLDEDLEESATASADQYLQENLHNDLNKGKKEFRDKNIVWDDEVSADLNLDTEDINTENIEMEDGAISLRNYQEELARPALKGTNVIIVAPTGSGKTRVALRIMQKHMELKRGREISKIIFLVNQVALANQQGEACKKHLPSYQTQVISGEAQRNQKGSLKDFIDKRDILVVTAQVLLDALVNKEIESITRFSLLIFDECHHCHAKHTFNQIMSYYMDIKLSESADKTSLPQIVGLTASVGVGKARNMDKAKLHIKKLMANLDAQEISTVCQNIGELSEYVSVPIEETRTVPKRQNDEFGETILRAMNTIEELVMQCELLQKLDNPEQYKAVLKAPAQKGSDQYTQWASKLWKETAKIRDADVRRFINPCRNHLQIYNDTLIIYNDARTRDAIDYLKQEMLLWKQSAILDKNEQDLFDLYEKNIKPEFVQDYPNPKLEALRDMIIEGFKDKPAEESRGIIFVKTRNLAKAITAWLKDTLTLKHLNPIEFVGSNNTGSGKDAMTKVEQVDALKFFRDGRHKLIVATSVAEEGLDISQCNLVIRYDHVTNEIAMVQSRGRGRAQNSQYFVLAEEGKGIAEKEELNMIREIMMHKAIIELQGDIARDPQKVRKELKTYQEEEQLDRKLEARKRKGRLMRTGEFELRCIRCDEYICMSSDVRKVQNAHHVVVLDDFEERVRITKTASRKVIDETIQFVGKLNCRKCGNDMGTVSIHRGLHFPVLKISSFLIVDTNGRQNTCKQWNKAPFEALPLTTTDFNVLLDKRVDSNVD